MEFSSFHLSSFSDSRRMMSHHPSPHSKPKHMSDCVMGVSFCPYSMGKSLSSFLVFSSFTFLYS